MSWFHLCFSKLQQHGAQDLKNRTQAELCHFSPAQMHMSDTAQQQQKLSIRAYHLKQIWEALLGATPCRMEPWTSSSDDQRPICRQMVFQEHGPIC